MKKLFLVILICLLAWPVNTFAESIKIFDATNLELTCNNPISNFTCSEGNNYAKLWTYAQKEVSLTCNDYYTVTLSSPVAGDTLIVDNIMFVNGENVCDRGDGASPALGPGTVPNCFSGGSTSPLGSPIENTHNGLGVLDISSIILPGTNVAVFALTDWGSVYGNTEIWLNVEGCTINGDQGCTPGYWKNHLDSWAGSGYTSASAVVTVFTSATTYVAADATLLDALKFKGGAGVDGAVRILLRSAVAALLNSKSAELAYPLYAPYLIVDVNAAINTGDRDMILALADELDLKNNLGCPLN